MIDSWWNATFAREPELDDLPAADRLAFLEAVNAKMRRLDRGVSVVVVGYLAIFSVGLLCLYVHPEWLHRQALAAFYPIVFVPLYANLWRRSRTRKVTRRLLEEYRDRSARGGVRPFFPHR